MKSRVTFIFTLLIVTGCTSRFDQETATKQILELHNQQRDLHFQEMADEFVDLLAPNHISVNRGTVTKPKPEENRARFKAYFNQVKFEKWDDVEPPLIQFSDDGSIAYSTVEKDVVFTYLNETGQMIRDSTRFAWVAIYKRYGDSWKIDCVASTNTPSVSQKLERPEGFTLITKAACRGPQGAYTSEVHTRSEGYMLFEQEYSYRDQPFRAVVYPDGSAFSLEESNKAKDRLSSAAVEMIRSHNFHMISLRPEQFFGKLTRKEALTFHGFDCVEYLGRDGLGQRVSLFYDEQEQYLRGFSLTNPLNTEESVEVIYKNYEESVLRPVARSIEIIQAQKDTFFFQFEEININEESFSEVLIAPADNQSDRLRRRKK